MSMVSSSRAEFMAVLCLPLYYNFSGKMYSFNEGGGQGGGAMSQFIQRWKHFLADPKTGKYTDTKFNWKMKTLKQV